MRGCGCLLGVLLIPIAVLGLMLFVVLPAIMDIKTVAPLNNVLQTVFCEKGETLSTQQHVGPGYEGGTEYSASFYCTNNDEVERDVTGRATLIGIIAFLVPFLIGLFAIIGSSMGMARRAVTMTIGDIPANVFVSNPQTVASFGGRPQKAPIAERLQSLKNAYDQGLITEAEYEAKRQDILREM